MIFFDTETCGLHGPIVLIQWAEDDGEIYFHNVWKSPVGETLEILEMLCTHKEGVTGFNLAFDWFHVCQTYTTLVQFSDHRIYPEDHIDQYTIYEEKGRDGDCLKPVSAMDLMLHARKGPYQSTMNRDDIRIRRVPTAIAWDLASELERRIIFKDIYFARRTSKKRWSVLDIRDDLNDVIPDFKDVVLRFAPSSALKVLAQDALNIEESSIRMFSDVDVPKVMHPKEIGFAPFALAIGKPGAWNGAWPDKIQYHADHWEYNKAAREYAKDDVEYTRGLYNFFGKPESNDDDSILACMVGAVRWRGFSIDRPRLEGLKKKAQTVIASLPFPVGSTAVVRKYLYQCMSETERVIIQGSTKGVILEEVSTWVDADVCDDCNGEGCEKCDDGLISTGKPHEAAKRARHVLDVRHAKKEIELYDKLLIANRFHASFVVIGTLSSRMAGGDDLNAQGIKKTKEVRGCFPLAFGNLELCGGDFDGFEVVLADAVYADPKLRKDLLSGKKIHALFGQHVYPGMSYEDILATAGTDDDKYSKSKQAVFAMLYGGEAYTLKERLGVDIEVAEKAYQLFTKDYKQVGKARAKIFEMFCSMRQPEGLGTKVEWHEPEDYVESMFGFRRYFTLENRICKALFDLAESPPKHWDTTTKVVRRDRIQTATGAGRSALFSAAFTIQAANMRAAANHVIQSSGAEITKKLETKIWEVQPSGIQMWRVQPMNIHDEIMCPTDPKYISDVTRIVDGLLEETKAVAPLIKMEWREGLTSWADK